MVLHIKNQATDRAVRRLARIKRTTLTRAVHEAVERELERERAQVPLIERLTRIEDRQAARSKRSGRPADRTLFDET
jgi:antitoxin VapB